MKNIKKLLGIIALVAIIGFSFIACEEEHQCSRSYWGYDNNSHWGICSCGNIVSTSFHTLTLNPTFGGSFYFPCIVCGYNGN